MDDAQATALGYRGGAKRVRPDGVPVWRDGTAPFGQSLYYRGVWAALALLIGLGSVSMAVFNSSRLTMVHIAFPAVLCAAGALFAIWQILLIVRAAQRTRPWLFALSAAIGLATVGLIGLTIHDRAVPALAELWAIRAGDTAIGDLAVEVSDDGRTLYVSGAYSTHSEEMVRRALDRNGTIREVVLAGAGRPRLGGLAVVPHVPRAQARDARRPRLRLGLHARLPGRRAAHGLAQRTVGLPCRQLSRHG